MKKYLEKVIKEKKAQLNDLKERSDSSSDIAEVRAIGESLIKLRDEITEAEEKLEELEAEGDEGTDEGTDQGADRGKGENRSLNPIASYGMQKRKDKRAKEDVLETLEYREAFAQYVRTGKFQMEQRADEVVTSQDIGMIIPKTILNEFIKELKVYGQLYTMVRKMNIQGGVEIPIQELIPEVKWITETEVSDAQKAPNLNQSISFGYHIAEARISQTLLSNIISLPVLEQEIAKLLAEAFVKCFDHIIINGTGTGQPTGILKDKRVKASNKIKMGEEDVNDWVNWRKKFFAIIPLAYRGQGILIMTANTWESKIMTLKDDNNRPLYQETYNPESGLTECRFAGKKVVLVEPDILKDYDTAAVADAFAIYLRPTDYAINSNLQIGFKRWFDEDKNKYISKGLTILDGKLLDVNGVYILQKQ